MVSPPQNFVDIFCHYRRHVEEHGKGQTLQRVYLRTAIEKKAVSAGRTC
jgi:hypothetical protein